MPPPLFTPDYQYRPAQAMASPPQTATLYLRQLRPTDGFNRRITLTPDSPVVSVGRASRSEAKNLSSAVNNALFDCPVISRKHAEVKFSYNRWATEGVQITITDMKSMHGTSVNGTKLRDNMPFQLRTGDTIRLGDHISRADSTYEGVTVILDSITTSSTGIERTTERTTKSRSGISVPSDSESDAFDDNDSVLEEPQSAHTTPEQKVAGQTSVKPAYPNIIDLDGDEDDEEVVEVLARTTIPDTYDDSNVAHSTFHHQIADMDEENDSWSNEDEFSDDGQLSMDDEDESSIVDPSEVECLMHPEEDEEDDENDDEGPEVMSSKRQPSQEIPAATTTRSHYDPVRGFLNENTKPRSCDPTHSLNPAFFAPANSSDHSSKWDMGPLGLVPQDHSQSYPLPSYPINAPASNCWAEPLQYPFNGNRDIWPTTTAPATLTKPASMGEWIFDDNTAAETSRVSKRKASEISTNIEATTDQLDSQVSPTVDTDMVPNTTTAPAVSATPVTEPLHKKRKIKQPRTKKSFIKTAATEAGKYAAGALVGSVGLVAFLASPIGARLAEC